MTRSFYNHFRLGDCLWTCHWLRHAALANPGDEFLFYCKEEHHWQLAPVVEGVNVKLLPLSQYYGGGVDTWINADGLYPPKDRDLVKFLAERFTRVAAKAGLAPVLQSRAEWLFDYPELWRYSERHFEDRGKVLWQVVDSIPQSGQFTQDANALTSLIARLRGKYGNSQVSTTRDGLRQSDYDIPVTTYGKISQTCNYILMISTGPSWPTFNATTESRIKNRFILLHDKEFLNYGREWPHFASVGACERHLEALSLI